MECIRYNNSLETLVMGGVAGHDSGDCVLLDFRDRFFAVADSSSRSLPLSRKLVEECGILLDGLSIHGRSDRPGDEAEVPGLIRAGLEGILSKLYGEGSCAFTGMLVRRAEQGVKIILLHAGDTCLYRYDLQAGTAQKLTRSNFWMAGRSRSLFQAEVVDIPGGSWLLLATDGMIDAARSYAGDLEGFFAGRLAGNLDNGFLNDLVSRRSRGELYDDVGMILFRPDAIEPHDKRIVMGGVAGGPDRERERLCVR